MTKNSVSKIVAKTVPAVFALSTAVFAYASLIERNNFKIRKYTINILPKNSKSIKILHLSDMHMLPKQIKKINFIRSLISLKPDIIISTGDNFGDTDALKAVKYALEPFLSLTGAFVYGSNDFIAPKFKNPFGYFQKPKSEKYKFNIDPSSLTHYLTNAGWKDLNNSFAFFADLNFIGLGDAHINLDNPKFLNSYIPTNPNRPIIAVSHAPYKRVIKAFENARADLMLFGHTHGGQVCLPQGKALVSNSDLSPKYASGLFNLSQNKYMHISAGLGSSKYAPYRLFCPPEASLITLNGACA